jgi:hypothetical protein
MKYAHVIVTLAAFGMLSAGWWFGKIDTTTYVPVAIAAVGGTMWMSNKAQTTPSNPPTPPKPPGGS